MKYLKSFNESFGTSKEYGDFLKSKAMSLDLFNDTMIEVKDFARVNVFRYLVDSKGHAVNTDVDDNEKYRMLYNCQIQYELVPGRNKFDKVLQNLNTIQLSIEELTSRAESEGLTLDENYYLVDKTTGHERVNHTFIISFLSSEIPTLELKDVYNDYISFQDKEYLDGLKRLREYYRRADIDFDRYMDTTDDAELILVGVFIDEDLYGVATYNRETKKFTIDDDEVHNSISAYSEL